ncbi:prohibitin family protein [Alcaligenes sp. 13f]|uniref:prohibitin family protein n=1 Tax=Alcaligenes sp. 13f TaxID=2841924 RepID=UPI001CF635F0|nr:prohibitin family protein [Alcaligenes sp. 13f]
MSTDKNPFTKLAAKTKPEGGTANYSKGLGFLGAAVVIFLILIVASMGSFLQVDQGERGVVLRNGKLVRVAEPGLDFKVPFFDTVRTISVRDRTVRMQLEAYSFDQQSASMVASVTYRVPETDVAQLYSEYGSLDALEARLLERKALDVIKNVFGKYTAAQSIQNREKLGADINEAMRVTLESAPLQMMGVQVEEVSFSKAYEQSIENRMLAQVQIETTRQQKETASIQAEIKVVQAEAEARAQRERYMAEADGIRLRGDAEAKAISARAQALAQNTNLVNLNAVEKWDGKLPESLVPGSAMPFIGLR